MFYHNKLHYGYLLINTNTHIKEAEIITSVPVMWHFSIYEGYYRELLVTTACCVKFNIFYVNTQQKAVY